MKVNVDDNHVNNSIFKIAFKKVKILANKKSFLEEGVKNSPSGY